MQDDSFTAWSDLTITDALTGRHPVVRAQPGYHGYGTRPYSLANRTVAGRRYLEAEWLPSGSRAHFTRKADAVAFIQGHEEIATGRPRDNERKRERVPQRSRSRGKA